MGSTLAHLSRHAERDESVVTTTEPVGFDLPDDDEWEPLPA